MLNGENKKHRIAVLLSAMPLKNDTITCNVAAGFTGMFHKINVTQINDEIKKNRLEYYSIIYRLRIPRTIRLSSIANSIATAHYFPKSYMIQ